MSERQTVLMMGRDGLYHPMKRRMAMELSRSHNVVVLTAPEYAHSYGEIPDVVVEVYESADVFKSGGSSKATLADAESRVAHIEAETGLRLYRATGSFFLYGRIVEEFGGNWEYLTTRDENVRAFVSAYDQLSHIFKVHSPDVVFYEAVDLVSTYIALALATKKGAFAFEPRPSPLGHGMGGLGFGLQRRNIVMEHLFRNPELIDLDALEAADQVIADPRSGLYRTFWSDTHRQMIASNSPLNPKWWLRRIINHRHLVVGIRNARWHLQGMKNRHWLRGRLARTAPNGRYIVFLLNHLPEASTCSQSPRWVNQNDLIEQLAINAPANVRIAVKEHPRTYGRRGKAFFAKLSRLPNVDLLHPSVGNYELLRDAEAILTTTGTVGFEGVVMEKRVGVLAQPFYSVFPAVRQLERPEEIFDALEDPTWRPEQHREELRNFVAACIQSQFEIGSALGAGLYPESAGAGVAAALSHTLDFIAQNQLGPEMFHSGLPRDDLREISGTAT